MPGIFSFLVPAKDSAVVMRWIDFPSRKWGRTTLGPILKIRFTQEALKDNTCTRTQRCEGFNPPSRKSTANPGSRRSLPGKPRIMSRLVLWTGTKVSRLNPYAGWTERGSSRRLS